MHHVAANQTRLISRIVRQLLHDERFDTLADLTDALKFKCAQLKIRLTDDDINASYSALTHVGVQLVLTPSAKRQLTEQQVHGRYPSKAEAGLMLRALQAAPKAVPSAPVPRDQDQDARDEDDARQRAGEMGILLP